MLHFCKKHFTEILERIIGAFVFFKSSTLCIWHLVLSGTSHHHAGAVFLQAKPQKASHQSHSVYGTNSHLFPIGVWQNGLTGYQYSDVWGAEAPSIRNKLFTELSNWRSATSCLLTTAHHGDSFSFSIVYLLLQILKSDPPVSQNKKKKREDSDLFSFVEAFLAEVSLLSSGVLEEDSLSQ